MGLKPEQIARVFSEMDKNPNEHTKHHISKREFFDYLDFDLPNFKSYGDGYGDIDPWGTSHKKFNTLPHTHPPNASTTNFLKSEPNVTKAKFYAWPHDQDTRHSSSTQPDSVKERDPATPSKIRAHAHAHVSSKSILKTQAMEKLLKDVSTPAVQAVSSIHASEPRTRMRNADSRALVSTKPSATAQASAADHVLPSPGRKENMKSFRDMDINGDGVIEPEEFAAAMSSAVPQDVKQHQRLRGS